WEPKLQRLARFVQTEASKLEKGRTYVQSPEEAPPGAAVETGPRGGTYYESFASGEAAGGRTQQEEHARVIDWLERHEVPQDEDGRYQFYHATPKENLEGIVSEGLQEGSLLETDPEDAAHFAGRDRDLARNQVVVLPVSVHPHEIRVGQWASLRGVYKVGVKLQKARVYIEPGEQPPEGAQVETGPRGGLYYEGEPVFPGFKRPQEHHADAALLDDEAVVLANEQHDIFIMALEELADTSAVFALASVGDPRMSDGPTRAAVKAHVSNVIAARLAEADMALPPGVSAPDYVSKMLSSWAASSSDDNDDSIAMQLAAAELFDVRSTPYIEEHYRAEYFREHEIGQAHLTRAKMIVQAMYDETQEFFKKHDIKELVLFRGMRWLDGAEPSEVQDVAWRAPSA
ncbi:hypothetical protein LCGC14_2834010, partial [marine sediment metagenome]